MHYSLDLLKKYLFLFFGDLAFSLKRSSWGFCREDAKVKKPILLHQKSNMSLVTNRFRAPKDLLFVNLSDESPDSGLRADDV